MVTKVSNSIVAPPSETSPPDSDDDPDESNHPDLTGPLENRTEHEMKDLSVHSFIDSLVSQITTTKSEDKAKPETESPPNYPLKTSTDLGVS